MIVSGVSECFRNRQIRVMQLDIFSDKTNLKVINTLFYTFDHTIPLGKIGFRSVYAKFPADN